MLEAVLSSKNKENVLLFLLARKEGYAFEISKYFSSSLSPVQNQLENLESGGVLISRLAGKTRLYSLNPRYAFIRELTALLEKAIAFLPDEDREKLLIYRTRPRRRNKP
jgi:predicted transcriptional regulator